MERTPRIFLLIFAIPVFFLGIASLGRAAVSFSKDYHWTPGYRPLDERQGRFEVYVRGELLDRGLTDGRLAIQDRGSWTPLSKSDVTVRYNQIDRVTRSPLLIGVGCLSAGLTWIFAVWVVGKTRTSQ